MTRDPEWEKAAERNQVRERSSVPSCFYLPKPRIAGAAPEETNPGTLAEKARRRFCPLLEAFGRPSPQERAARADAFRKRIGRACAHDREAVSLSRARFAAAIDVAQPQFLRETRSLARQVGKTKPSSESVP